MAGAAAAAAASAIEARLSPLCASVRRPPLLPARAPPLSPLLLLPAPPPPPPCSSSWVRNQAAWEHFRELTRPPVDRRSVAEKERNGEKEEGRKELGAFSVVAFVTCVISGPLAHDAHKDGDCGRSTNHDVRLARD